MNDACLGSETVTVGTEPGPGEALRLIGERLTSAGLDVRTYYRAAALTEICVTNPADLDRGSMSVNRDGFMTWERTASIADGKSLGEVADVMAVLLAAGSSGSQEC